MATDSATIDLAAEAKSRGIKYFLISFLDLFGTMRAKLVPAAAIAQMTRDGAGFAGAGQGCGGAGRRGLAPGPP